MTRLLELLPLPSPSVSHWLYSEAFGVPYLKSRKTYQNHVAPQRVTHIRNRLFEFRPEFVIFYGLSYMEWWSQIADLRFVRQVHPDLALASDTSTVFGAIKHPTARGVTNEYFREVGETIAVAARIVRGA